MFSFLYGLEKKSAAASLGDDLVTVNIFLGTG